MAGGNETGATSNTGRPPAIAAVRTFDPEGTGQPGEHDDRVHLLVDGDASTTWPTETYDQANLGRKSGVGVVLVLDESVALDRLEITSPDRGWTAEVAVVDADPGPEADRASFGPAHTTVQAISDVTVADLSDTAGSVVLVWITHLGDGPPPVRLELAEAVVR